MGLNDFFDEAKEQSKVKSAIVASYFWEWANIIGQYRNALAYVDLFSGPGRYRDGIKSTPIKIIEKTIKQDDLSEKMMFIFNDVNCEYVRELKKEIAKISGIERLRYKPKVFNNEVGIEVVKIVKGMGNIPIMSFIDPWGYKGLSLQLIKSFLDNWGSDCIFFFNYNRINRDLSNPFVIEHMNALFGRERADSLRDKVDLLNSFDREMTIVNELAEALKELGGRYVLPFCFKKDTEDRTSHHLIFVSKHIRGYEKMKEVMAKKSSEHIQGVPNFQYNRVSNRALQLLFEFDSPLAELGDMLLEKFSGQTLTMEQIYIKHHVDRPFIKPNYKAALYKLEEEGKITAIPPAQDRRKGTFADHIRVLFP